MPGSWKILLLSFALTGCEAGQMFPFGSTHVGCAFAGAFLVAAFFLAGSFLAAGTGAGRAGAGGSTEGRGGAVGAAAAAGAGVTAGGGFTGAAAGAGAGRGGADTGADAAGVSRRGHGSVGGRDVLGAGVGVDALCRACASFATATAMPAISPSHSPMRNERRITCDNVVATRLTRGAHAVRVERP